MSPAAALLVIVSVVCWILFKSRRTAVSNAQNARESLTRAERERDQLRGELDMLTERVGRAANAESALTVHIAERDRALAHVRSLQQQLSAASATPRVGGPDLVALNSQLEQKRAELATLQHEVGALSMYAELQSFGLYRPHFAFDAPEGYKTALEGVREREASMLKDKTAAVFSRQWMVDGSVQKGQQMIARQVKLMLRAFNGECDAAAAKVRFNNVIALEERLKSAFAAINKLAETYQCAIAEPYLELKLAELRLSHEYALKLNEQREEQRRIREQMREEDALRREAEEAQREAEREEARAATALERARKELQRANQAEQSALETKVAELEARLAQAHTQKERAVSMAQLTRVGHVYVISNEGSFGPNVYKIGMTRRQDPIDRVHELGDASVPFEFDIHAMIFSENAPELERKLHHALASARVNLVNERKEFFAVTLEEIEHTVRGCHVGAADFTRLAVAEEWRQTRLMRESRTANDNADLSQDARSRAS